MFEKICCVKRCNSVVCVADPEDPFFNQPKSHPSLIASQLVAAGLVRGFDRRVDFVEFLFPPLMSLWLFVRLPLNNNFH